MMMMINNDIWSKFDEVMERELSGKDRVSFYKLPSHIRVMIWNMKNREEKIENLKKENKYNKSLLMYEFNEMLDYTNSVEKNVEVCWNVVCPRRNQMVRYSEDEEWFRWGDELNELNGCSLSWLESPSKEMKNYLLKVMIECFDKKIDN
tara:strand:+ start:3039 stop:3485 length:447 start_codon:yes stop_codon:yes gene_type:complete